MGNCCGTQERPKPAKERGRENIPYNTTRTAVGRAGSNDPQYASNPRGDPVYDRELSLNNSNCSLTFDVQTISQSNKIQTEFPIKLIANYNLTCNITNLTAYYKITPLEILVIGRYRNMDENIKSMIELNSTKFHFKIHQSSTIRLCILSADDDDDEDDNDNDHRICQQIHIGINKLYDFWSLPLKIVYIFMICSLSAYYIFFYARGKWRKGGKKHKSKASSRKLSAIVETNHDTFENEKVNDDESSGEEHEEQSS